MPAYHDCHFSHIALKGTVDCDRIMFDLPPTKGPRPLPKKTRNNFSNHGCISLRATLPSRICSKVLYCGMWYALWNFISTALWYHETLYLIHFATCLKTVKKWLKLRCSVFAGSELRCSEFTCSGPLFIRTSRLGSQFFFNHIAKKSSYCRKAQAS